MTKIRCEFLDCVYNKLGDCSKGEIKLIGLTELKAFICIDYRKVDLILA